MKLHHKLDIWGSILVLLAAGIQLLVVQPVSASLTAQATQQTLEKITEIEQKVGIEQPETELDRVLKEEAIEMMRGCVEDHIPASEQDFLLDRILNEDETIGAIDEISEWSAAKDLNAELTQTVVCIDSGVLGLSIGAVFSEFTGSIIDDAVDDAFGNIFRSIGFIATALNIIMFFLGSLLIIIGKANAARLNP